MKKAVCIILPKVIATNVIGWSQCPESDVNFCKRHREHQSKGSIRILCILSEHGRLIHTPPVTLPQCEDNFTPRRTGMSSVRVMRRHILLESIGFDETNSLVGVSSM